MDAASKAPSLIRKRSVVIDGHKTSISIEDPFWDHLRSMAARIGCTMSDLISKIEARRRHSNLSSALRLAVLEDVQTQNRRAA